MSYPEILSTFFSLSVNAFSTLCIVAGIGLAIAWAVSGPANIAKIAVTLPASKLIWDIVRSIVERQSYDFEFAKTLLLKFSGVTSLMASSFIPTYLFLALIASMAFAKPGDRLKGIWRFFYGGFKELDESYGRIKSERRGLSESLKREKERSIKSLLEIKAINVLLDSIEQSMGATERKLVDTLTLILFRGVTTAFPEKRLRIGLYLKNKTDGCLDLHCFARSDNAMLPTTFEPVLPLTGSVAGETYVSGEIKIFSRKTKKKFKRSYKAPSTDRFSKSFMCIPVSHDFRKWGVLTLDCGEEDFPDPTDHELVYLNLVAYLIGYAVYSSGVGEAQYGYEAVRGRG